MSKQANKTLIGVFVVGAIALVLAAIIIFGSGKFLSKRNKFVMFFDGSVKGLNVGSPVTFRGVKIGDVTQIVLLLNTETMSAMIPVYIEIDPGKMTALGKEKHERKQYQYYRGLIQKGLKAQLQLQSFVTGQLMIGLDFHPDKPGRLVGIEAKYPEIPTIPTSMEELQKTFEDLPLKEMVEKLDGVLEGMNQLVNSPELHQSIASADRMLKSADALLKDIDAEVKPLMAELKGTSVAARGAFAQAEKTLAFREGVPGELAVSLKESLASARSALSETEKAVSKVGTIAAQNENVGYQLNRTLDEISSLARSLRSLADYLEQHPEALVRGKSSPKGE